MLQNISQIVIKGDEKYKLNFIGLSGIINQYAENNFGNRGILWISEKI